MMPLFWPNLTLRCRQPEIMDQPDLPPSEHDGALRGLRTLNRISGTGAVVWRGIQNLLTADRSQPLRVLDVACGGGDIAVYLACRARAVNRLIEVHACDLSPRALEVTETRAKQLQVHVPVFLFDVLRDPWPADFDVITSTLFLHHLPEESAMQFLRQAGHAARKLLLIDDLCRTRAGHLLAWLGARALTRSRVVWYDGPVSVQAAFTLAEARDLARAAGLATVHIQRHWPQRYLLSWRRD